MTESVHVIVSTVECHAMHVWLWLSCFLFSFAHFVRSSVKFVKLHSEKAAKDGEKQNVIKCERKSNIWNERKNWKSYWEKESKEKDRFENGRGKKHSRIDDGTNGETESERKYTHFSLSSLRQFELSNLFRHNVWFLRVYLSPSLDLSVSFSVLHRAWYRSI